LAALFYSSAIHNCRKNDYINTGQNRCICLLDVLKLLIYQVLQVNTFFILLFLLFRYLPMTVQMSVMISAEEIQAKVKELGAQIDAHYAHSDKELVLIGLLRGSVIFMADLCRVISKLHELDFMTVSSYGGGTVSSRDVKILKDLDGEIRGKDVLVVEDIIDSGNTLSKVLEILQTRQPNSIELCTLVSKPSRREIELEVKFLGFEVEDKFIVGYGLDYDQKYRHIPFIGEIGL